MENNKALLDAPMRQIEELTEMMIPLYDVIEDYFYEQIVLPEYRRLILLYYSLCKVSGVKVEV